MVPNDHVTVEFALWGPLTRADLPGLSARFCRLCGTTRPALVLCDVGHVPAVDAVTVDALARLELAARRYGCEVRLVRASEPLLELARWMGLGDVIRA